MLCLMLEIGVTVLISVNGVICFGSSLFNPGVVVDWFDSSCVALTRWFMRGYSLVRVGGLVVVCLLLLFLVFW